MAKLELSLSKRLDENTGKAEILIRFFAKSFNLRAKSGIYVKPEYFEYHVKGLEEETASPTKAAKMGWTLRPAGEIVVRQRVVNPDTTYHKKQAERMANLKRVIMESFESSDKDAVNGDWLKLVVDKFNHPEKYDAALLHKDDIYSLIEEYLSKKQFSLSYTKSVMVLENDMRRYELFVRMTDRHRKDFKFDINKTGKEDIEDFISYLRNEKTLSDEYPKIFNSIMTQLNHTVKLVERGDNTIIVLIKKLKSFLVWLRETEKTTNNPFEGITIGSEHYGTPYYISKKERDIIATCDLSQNPALAVQRDIFIFHCFVGCRVSDLVNFTKDNISDGILTYIPIKTRNEGEQPVAARVPLTPTALTLVKKYDGVDRKGRLFPFITPQKYNEDIKEIFTAAGITRKVTIRDPKTGNNVIRPLNEIASSHLARRTFIGNTYLYTPDPNIISKMSGHVEGSKAFARYRNIEDSTLKSVVKNLE